MAIAALPTTVTAHVGVYLDAGSLTQFGRTDHATLAATSKTMSKYKDSFDTAIQMGTSACNGGYARSRLEGNQWPKAYYEYRLADAQHNAILGLLVEKGKLTIVPKEYRENLYKARIPFFRKGWCRKVRSIPMVP